MAQVTTGIRAMLSNPILYELFQRGVGAASARRELVRAYIEPRPGESVLDIGCGTADVVKVLSGVRYVGFDPSESYIESARRRHAAPGRTFFAGGIDDVYPERLGRFDVVIAQGVLHHVDDDQAAKVFAVARAVLEDGGRLVTNDPCLVEGQSRIARFLIEQDRGRNVRTEAEYRKLAEQSFERVEAFIRHDLLRIPYSHAIIVCRAG